MNKLTILLLCTTLCTALQAADANHDSWEQCCSGRDSDSEYSDDESDEMIEFPTEILCGLSRLQGSWTQAIDREAKQLTIHVRHDQSDDDCEGAWYFVKKEGKRTQKNLPNGDTGFDTQHVFFIHPKMHIPQQTVAEKSSSIPKKHRPISLAEVLPFLGQSKEQLKKLTIPVRVQKVLSCHFLIDYKGEQTLSRSIRMSSDGKKVYIEKNYEERNG